jgi:hypothetical protein
MAVEIDRLDPAVAAGDRCPWRRSRRFPMGHLVSDRLPKGILPVVHAPPAMIRAAIIARFTGAGTVNKRSAS